MIDVLKDDATRYMDVVKTAVENEDTETSHYAVSAIMEVKRKLALTIRQLSDEFARNPDDIGVACEYRDALKQYMDSGFMDENTLRVYRNKYIDVLRTIISKKDGDIENDYEEKMLCEIECADYTEAEQTGLCLFGSVSGPGRPLFAYDPTLLHYQFTCRTATDDSSCQGLPSRLDESWNQDRQVLVERDISP